MDTLPDAIHFRTASDIHENATVVSVPLEFSLTEIGEKRVTKIFDPLFSALVRNTVSHRFVRIHCKSIIGTQNVVRELYA